MTCDMFLKPLADFHPFAVLILFSVSPVYHVHLVCMFFEAHICKLEEQNKFI